MHEKLIILDFGSQTTQLIGRRVRELNMYCEIVPYNKFPHDATDVKGVILSGSPYSVYDENAFKFLAPQYPEVPLEQFSESPFVMLTPESSMYRRAAG